MSILQKNIGTDYPNSRLVRYEQCLCYIYILYILTIKATSMQHVIYIKNKLKTNTIVQI